MVRLLLSSGDPPIVVRRCSAAFAGVLRTASSIVWNDAPWGAYEVAAAYARTGTRSSRERAAAQD